MKKLHAFIFLLLANIAAAQKAPQYGFLKVTEADLNKRDYSIEQNASAVVLADVGKTKIVNNGKNWFGFEFTRHKRVHILTKSSYNEADIEIALYTRGENSEKLLFLKAYTYNLEDGKIKESKLDKASVYTVRANKNNIIKRFTLPAVKEGSIIDIEYSIRSDYLYNLTPWSFQNEVPTLWSEYHLSLPQFLGYLFLRQGVHPYFISEKDDRVANFSVSDNRGTGNSQGMNFTSTITDYRWVMKDIPSLKKENFVTTPFNYLSKIDFRLSAYRYPLTEQELIHPWNKTAEELLEKEDFGKDLSEKEMWIESIANSITNSAGNELEQAKNIYAFVRDNFTCINHDALYTSQPLKAVAKQKKRKCC